LSGFLEEGSLVPLVEKQRRRVDEVDRPLNGESKRRFIPGRKEHPERHRFVNNRESFTDEEAETRHRRIAALGVACIIVAIIWQ
jgi:hypothetical protein